jgi:hypothetical protein
MRHLFLLLSLLNVFSVLQAQDIARFSDQIHLLDLTKLSWLYVAREPNMKLTYAGIKNSEDWKSIGVGKRWENVGHPELKDKTVWVKLFFEVPVDQRNYQLGFFASMIDDEGVIYLNGDSLSGFKYKTGGKIPHPVDVDITSKIKWGGKNELLIEIRDVVTQRMGGIVGSACLYKTLPNEVTKTGGIVLKSKREDTLAVMLHLGDARLVKNKQESFTQNELEQIQTPPSILRKDELIIVVPANRVSSRNFLKVDLDKVASTRSNELLHISCDTLPTRIKLYDLIKMPINVDATFNNPFDPKQITVQALVETPTGRIEKVYAFFGQDFEQVAVNEEEEILLPASGNPWKLYYRPREKGIHKVELLAQDSSGVTRITAGSFEAIPADARGYLHKSSVEPRLFEFDNGEMYYGKGPSGWFRGSRYIFGGNTRWVSLKLLTDYYERKADNGSNFEYLSTFHFGSLYLNDGFIDQHIAWKMEQALRSMERNGLYWIVFHDGILRSYQNGFETLPYAAVNGGPCKNIFEVYTNPIALEMQKNELRYMVSRWSDSPSLWIWNCGDESQPGTELSKLMVRDWLKELHSYIQQTDIYKHSNSIGEYEDAILNGGDVILLGDWYYHNNNQGDRYDQQCNGEKSQDAVGYNLCLQEEFKDLGFPIINIEGGICQWDNFSWLSGEKYLQFPEAIDFHQHLWLSFFTKMAAGGTEWLCQTVDSMNELYHAKAIERFLKNESLTKTFHQIIVPEISNRDLQVFALQANRKTLVWINNKFYNWFNIGVQKRSPVVISNATLRLKVEKDGYFDIEIWDTRKGIVIKKKRVKSTNGYLNYVLPDIDKDIALKIVGVSSL